MLSGARCINVVLSGEAFLVFELHVDTTADNAEMAAKMPAIAKLSAIVSTSSFHFMNFLIVVKKT